MGGIRFLRDLFLLWFLRTLPVRMLAAWAVTLLPFWNAVAKTVVTLVPSFGRILRVTFSFVPRFEFSLGPQDELILLFLRKGIKTSRVKEECLLSSCGFRVYDSAVLVFIESIFGVLIKRFGFVFR